MRLDHSSRCALRLFAVATAFVFIVGCSRPVDKTPAGPPPSTLPVLRLMPDSAAAAFGIPPVDLVGGNVVAVLRRIVAGVDVALLDPVLAALERELDSAQGRETFAEAMASIGFATDAPMGVYIGVLEAGANASPFALTFTTTNEERLREWLTTLDQLANDTPIPALDPAVSEVAAAPLPSHFKFGEAKRFGEGAIGMAVHGDRVVLGFDDAFVSEVEARIASPRAVAYGTKACPSQSVDAFTALVRMDRVNGALDPMLNLFVESGELTEMISGYFSSPSESEFLADDPVLITFDWGPDRIELAARADMTKHETLRKGLGRPTPLRLAKAAPASTLGLVSFRFNENSKDFLIDLFGRMFVQAEAASAEFAVDFPLTDTLGQWLRWVDDELSLALTGFDGERPKGVAMLAVRNRSSLSSLLLTLPVPGEFVETYRRVDIKIMPQTTLYYATARNTIVIGNELDEVRETLGYLLSKQVSPVFDAFQPPVDLDANRYAVLYARSAAVAEIVASLLQLPEWSLTLLNGAETVVDDVRVTAGIQGTWLDTRMVVHFTPLAAEP